MSRRVHIFGEKTAYRYVHYTQWRSSLPIKATRCFKCAISSFDSASLWLKLDWPTVCGARHAIVWDPGYTRVESARGGGCASPGYGYDPATNSPCWCTL